MFTNKQRWRRVGTNTTLKKIVSLEELACHYDKKSVDCSSSDNESVCTSPSSTYLDDIGIPDSESAFIFRSPSVASSRSCMSPDQHLRKKSKKRVVFLTTVRVILIPTREEMLLLLPDLFYTHEDICLFKEDAAIELEVFRQSPECAQQRALCYNQRSNQSCNNVPVPETSSHLLQPMFSYLRSMGTISAVLNSTEPMIQNARSDNSSTLSARCSLRQACILLYQPWPCLDDQN